MEILKRLLETIEPLFPTTIVIVGVVIILYLVHLFLSKRQGGIKEYKFRQQVIMSLVSLVGITIIILVLPVSDTLRGQLLSLFGILLTAVLALSSTTLVGNAMAGLMLRAVRSFRGGDFISVGEQFGRVSERGLFHVEVQTEHRDLITIPNLYLVTNPVKVIRSSGTIVRAEVSLGYDIVHSKIEKLLLEAAKAANLEEPFVHIIDLGDFSITYRVAGLLKEVKQLISTRSRLREMILDKLHEGGVEIVSPTFMNTRAIPEQKLFIPESGAIPDEKVEIAEQTAVEEVVFDKADQAETLEKLRQMYDDLAGEIESVGDELDKVTEKPRKDFLKEKKERLSARHKQLADLIKHREKEEKSD